MINKVVLSDLERFNELGSLVNSNFANLFKLDSLLASEYDCIYGYYDKDNLVGFIHINKLYENMDIVNIVVDEDYRRQGIGTRLMNYVLNLFIDIDSALLEVNEKNEAAINLYKDCGFEVINVRKNYYGNDDALIMKRVI
jgi:ribosomal-protein-alanine N-acetyltransferase